MLWLDSGLGAASALPAADHKLLIDEDLRANANVLKVRMDVDDEPATSWMLLLQVVRAKTGALSVRSSITGGG